MQNLQYYFKVVSHKIVLLDIIILPRGGLYLSVKHTVQVSLAVILTFAIHPSSLFRGSDDHDTSPFLFETQFQTSRFKSVKYTK